MSSNPEIKPVKLFVRILKEEALEERLTLKFGPVDHRSSLVPLDGAIHRVFLAFERLVESDVLPEIKWYAESVGKEFQTAVDVGFLDNRRVILAVMENAAHRLALGGNIFGEETIQFKSGGAHFLPWTAADFQTSTSQELFLTMRKLYRDQLRSMCLLRKQQARDRENRGQTCCFPFSLSSRVREDKENGKQHV